MVAKFDRFKKSKSTRTNHDEELGPQRDIAIGVINLGVIVLPSNRYCFMCGHATTQRFMEFQEYKKVSKFHLLRRNLEHLPFLSRFLLRGSHITSSSFNLQMALKFSSFLAKAQNTVLFMLGRFFVCGSINEQ